MDLRNKIAPTFSMINNGELFGASSIHMANSVNLAQNVRVWRKKM